MIQIADAYPFPFSIHKSPLLFRIIKNRPQNNPPSPSGLTGGKPNDTLKEKRITMKKDQKRWDKRFKGKAFALGKEANFFLRRHLRFLPRGRALDLATGE